jgi:hypothetical protein
LGVILVRGLWHLQGSLLNVAHELPKENTMRHSVLVLVALVCSLSQNAFAQESKTEPTPTKKKAWYNKLSIGGYFQVRYSRLGHELSDSIGSNDNFLMPQDKSFGKKGGFLIRRARVKLTGDVHPLLYMYIQMDLAGASVGDTQHIAAIKDFYGDVYTDRSHEYRFRIGQSKVPYGWENMQSSSNRLSLDRAEALNSGSPGERDLGVFFYYAPQSVRKLFKHLLDQGLKGSGDYGMLALGAYNGQGANIKEGNDNRHVIARVTYPFRIGDQIMEVAGGGYTGRYHTKLSEGIVASRPDFRDSRAHASLMLYPQPFGFQTEFTVGIGPELVKDSSNPEAKPTVVERPLHGGYFQVMYKHGPTICFSRAQFYRGARKSDVNAPRADVSEVETGVEWLVHKSLEITASYVVGRRQSLIDSTKMEDGRAIRLQAQLNY